MKNYLGHLLVSILVFNYKGLVKEIQVSGGSLVFCIYILYYNVKFRQLVLIVITHWLQWS